MEFLFECTIWYQLQIEYSKKNSISTSSHVLFCLLYKLTKDDFFTISRRFPNAFRRISRSCPKARQSFFENFRRVPLITKIFEDEPMMFRSYRNTSKYLLPPFSLIPDFAKQNTRGNVSKIPVSLACYWQIGSNPLVWPSNLLYVILSGCDWWILIRSVNNTQDWRKFWKRFRGCFVFQSRVPKKTVVRDYENHFWK